MRFQPILFSALFLLAVSFGVDLNAQTTASGALAL
jgi:hypothetical protein